MHTVYRGLVIGLLASSPLFAADTWNSIEDSIRSGHYTKAEQLLRARLTENPTDAEASFRLAKVLSWQKKYADAEIAYRALLAKEPDNTDYLFGLAQIYVWQGQPDPALPILEKIQTVTPDDPDVWRLQIQALAAKNDPASIRQAISLRQQAAQQFPHLSWPTIEPITEWSETSLERDFARTRTNQIELGASYENLTNHVGHWRSEFLTFEHRYQPRQLVYGTVQQTERFAKNDLQLLMGTYQPLSPNLTLNLEGTVSPTSSVLAKNSIMASLQGGLGYGAFLTGGYRHSEYGTGPVEQGFAILESYFSDYRFAYTARATHSFQRTQFGHQFDLSCYYDDISSITFSYGFGAQTGGFQGVVYDTDYFGLRGRHWLNRDWALTWEFGHTKQGRSYTREGVMLGIRRAF